MSARRLPPAPIPSPTGSSLRVSSTIGTAPDSTGSPASPRRTSTGLPGLADRRDARAIPAGRVRVDLIDQLRPDLGRQIVAHPVDDPQARVEDRAGGRAPGSGAD